MARTQSIVEIGDCLARTRSLKASSVDVVVTSPPYNLGKDYATYLDRRGQDEYLAWFVEWASEVARVLKPQGSFFLNLGGSPRNPTIPHELLFRILQKARGGSGGPFMLQNTIHWIKSITITHDGKGISKGHFKATNSLRYITDCHEYIFHLTKTGAAKLDRLAVG